MITSKELNAEISHHRQNVVDLFEQGQTIHKEYMDAPEKQNLCDEIERFTVKLNAGIAEMDKVADLQSRQSEKII